MPDSSTLQIIAWSVAITSGLIAIWSRIRPAERLRARATLVPYERDPLVKEVVSDLSAKLEEGIKDDIEALWKSRNILREIRWDSTRLTGYWHIDIHSNGHHALKNVRLTLDDFVVATITRTGEEPQTVATQPVKLGDLSPHEKVEVKAWVRGIRWAGFWRKPGITLVHDTGRAAIRTYLPAHSIFAFITTNWILFVLLLWVILQAYVSYLADRTPPAGGAGS